MMRGRGEGHAPEQYGMKGGRSMKAKQLAFAGLAIALAAVVSVAIKLPSLPNGGSVTLFGMLIISMVGYWYGPATGMITAVTYGVFQFITGPYFVHPLQVLLDYPLAFGALGLSGFFAEKKNGLIWGYIVGVLGRLLFHELSGLIFYTSYIGNLQGNLAAVWATLLYNASYVLTEGFFTLVVLFVPSVRIMLEQLKTLARK